MLKNMESHTKFEHENTSEKLGLVKHFAILSNCTGLRGNGDMNWSLVL